MSLETRKNKFLKKAKEIHGDSYDYSLIDYINVDIKVEVICLLTSELHHFFITPDKHINRKQRCGICFKVKTKTTEQFIKQANEIHGDKYDYSNVKYINSNTHVDIICHRIGLDNEEHGIFLQIPGDHIDKTKKCGCPKCAYENNLGRNSKTTKQFIKDAKNIHGNKYYYDLVEYIGANEKIKIICNNHDEQYIFEQSPGQHLRGRGCPKCNGGIKFTKEQFIENAKNIHGSKRYDYLKVNYINCDTKIKIICTGENHDKEQHIFIITPYNHINRRIGCYICKPSGYSKIQIKTFELIEKELNIKIQKATDPEREFIIYYNKNELNPKWYSTGKLKVDGYIKEYNLIIEYNGCYYHGCCFHFDNEEEMDLITMNGYTHQENLDRTYEKQRLIEKSGYEYIDLWECFGDKINIQTIKEKIEKIKINQQKN